MSTDHGVVFSRVRGLLGPEGLCADRILHPAHLHESSSLGRFWCTGDPRDREPGRSERRAQADGAVYGIRPHRPMTAEEAAERERLMRATPLVRFLGRLDPDRP